LALGVFLDTSAVAKLYHGEIGSEFTERIVEESAGACFISRLAVVEMHSVLALKERTGAILAGESEPICRRFRGDVKRRRFRVVALRARHFEAAETLLASHGAVHGLRTLDSLQLAVALDLFRHQLVDSMITADRVLCRVAPLQGLVALDPEA
jgi:predicted nucleic acid-binding protein